jgi:flagellar biosynthetic protein FliO
MEYTQQLVAAATVLGLLGTVLWYARKRGWVSGAVGARADRRIEALERLALGPHHTLHLVRVGDEALVVACSPAGCALLDRVPARDGAAPTGVRP